MKSYYCKIPGCGDAADRTVHHSVGAVIYSIDCCKSHEELAVTLLAIHIAAQDDNYVPSITVEIGSNKEGD